MSNEYDYSPGNMCGECLHHKKAHELDAKSGRYLCFCCQKLCKPEDFNRINKSTRGVMLERAKEYKQSMQQAKAEIMAKAPKELTGA